MKTVAIIGGGLAGTACAYVLKQNGLRPVIYEASDRLASGASGNDIGLYNPRLSAERHAESDYFTAAYSLALRVFPVLENIDWRPCGALHVMNDVKKQKRLPQTCANWGWPDTQMRLVDAREASEIAGVALDHDALYLPQSGIVSPKKLCAAYAKNAELHLNTKIETLDKIEADHIILACGSGVRAFLPEIALRSVRGQITYARATDYSQSLKCNLCYGGYLAPAFNGVHAIGATFQRWLDHDEVIKEDDTDNLNKLHAVSPSLADGLIVVGQRAAIRVTTADHMPVIGRAPGHENIFLSAGHGSHGILGSLMAAHLLTDLILDRPRCLSRETIARIDPARCHTGAN